MDDTVYLLKGMEQMVRSVPFTLAVLSGQRTQNYLESTKLEEWAKKIIKRLSVPPAVNLSKTYASIAD